MFSLADWKDVLLLVLSVMLAAWISFEFWAAKAFPIPPWTARVLSRFFEMSRERLCPNCRRMPVDEHSPWACGFCCIAFCDEFCLMKHKQRIHRVQRKPGPYSGGGEAA